MASTSMRTRLFADESLSLRSFRPNAPPPSLKASSLKLPHSFSFSTKSKHRVIEPTIQDLISDEDFIAVDMGLQPTSSDVPESPKISSSKDQATPHHPWSKPRTIIRMLTTKFNPRSPFPSPVVSHLSTIPSGPNAFSKGSREAALRERGLLPPLKTNKDLSAQEKEQDRVNIPIPSPTDDPHRLTDADPLSPADLIKKEWEEKNRSVESTQLQRMKSFKFGGSSTSSVPSPPNEILSQSAVSANPDITIPSTPNLQLSLQTQPSSLAVPHVPPSTVPTSSLGSRPASPLLDIPIELAAHLFPLPPSPRSLSQNLDWCSRPPSPTSVPLPPSPSVRSAFYTTSLRDASGACTPKPNDIRETCPTPTPTPPTIALTPCVSVFPDSAPVDDAITSLLHKPTDLSVPLDESASSIQTPSLDSNSYTTNDSTLGTSESSAISGKGKFGGLRIKTHEGSIPVIVESPIEDGFSEEQDVVIETAAVTAPIGGNETKFLLSAPPLKKRGMTDPTNGNLDRKKSMIMNPFKRGNSTHADHSMALPAETTQRQRRLSVRASLSNMRRSVVGTLSRKTTAENGGVRGGRMFDASHLPPSPIFPTSANGLHSPISPGFRTDEGGESLAVRRAVSPTVYSPGQLLLEASHIEDEESRRVTEMAFLT